MLIISAIVATKYQIISAIFYNNTFFSFVPSSMCLTMGFLLGVGTHLLRSAFIMNAVVISLSYAVQSRLLAALDSYLPGNDKSDFLVSVLDCVHSGSFDLYPVDYGIISLLSYFFGRKFIEIERTFLLIGDFFSGFIIVFV